MTYPELRRLKVDDKLKIKKRIKRLPGWVALTLVFMQIVFAGFMIPISIKLVL